MNKQPIGRHQRDNRMQKHATYLAFLALGVIWGSNFIFMKWAADFISPIQITLLRVVFGFIPLFFVALLTKSLSWAHLRHGHHFIAMALLATALYYLAFAKGTALLPSSIAGMLSGSIPLFTFLAALVFLRDEPVNVHSVSGTLLGFIGVLLIAKPWHAGAGQINPEGVFYMVGGALSVGLSFVYARKFVKPLKLNPITLATYQTGIAMGMLLLTTDMGGIGSVFDDTRAMLGLILGLGILGTGAAYIIYYFLVNQMGAIAASGVTYIPPVVALTIGAVLVGEEVRSLDILAMGLILTGVWRVQVARQNAP